MKKRNEKVGKSIHAEGKMKVVLMVSTKKHKFLMLEM